MLKTLSRSTILIFTYDFLVLLFSTIFSMKYFMYSSIFSFGNIIVIALVIIAGLFSLYLKGQYFIREHNLTIWNFYRLFEGVIFTHVPAILLFFWVDKIEVLKFLGLNIIIIYILLCFSRLFYHFYLFYLKTVKKVLIIGANERAKIIADEIQSKYALKMSVAGFVQTNKEEEEFINDVNFPVYKDVDSLKQIIKENKINIVVITEPTELILTIPRRVKIYKMPEFYELVTGKFYIDEKTITELYYQYVTHQSFIYDYCKRVYDIIAALIILTVTLPITSFTALRVWLTDHNNPIYTQPRVGRDGKVFKCYKLRTMYANDYVPKEGNINEDTAGINDDRVIPFCKFVRKARFDEIPQMINILKGEISIVGPRAEWEDLVNIYKKEVPFYSCRMWVKTGWTGWAQINQGHCVNSDDVSEKLQYDLFYLKNRNVVWEILILIKAVFMALGGRHN